MHIIRQSLHILLDAFYRFDRDDGWAIASHIALSILMSVFPFLIVVTAIAGFIGSVDLANEVTRLLFATWPGRGPARDRNPPCADDLARRIGYDQRRIRALVLFEWNREPAHRAQSRLWPARAAKFLGAAAGIDRLCAAQRHCAVNAGLFNWARPAPFQGRRG